MKRHPGNEVAVHGKKRKKFELDKIEGDLGLIESVLVQNFMCHDHLSLNFGPHINFIIGQNGSGKSAILTALILVLGGNSRNTDRCSNIKSFVKKGKNRGKIEVILRNKGDLAYKPDIYGEKITVIREFTKEGTSSYKIKSESGIICSTQKTELMNIVQAMDIMVDSPICILTQANSKKFLISKDAKGHKLFEFFYKATGLEILEEKYKTMHINKDSAEEDLKRKKESVPEMKKELAKLQKYLDSSRRISDYKNELIWSGVIAMENMLQEKEEEYQKLEEQKVVHKQELEKCKVALAQKCSELEEYLKQNRECAASMTKHREELEKFKEAQSARASALRKCEEELKKKERDEAKLVDEIVSLRNCIAEQQKKNQDNINEDKKRREEALQKLERNNLSLKERQRNLSERIQSKMAEENNFKENVDLLTSEIARHEYNKNQIARNLVTTRNALKNKVNAFGNHTQEVLQDINRRLHHFRNPLKIPVGPIGMYIEVKDPKWSNAIEFSIGTNFLNSFCVDNHDDSLVLRDILRKYYNDKLPSIIVSPFEAHVFDVSEHRVQCQYPAVLDMLTIQNHIVANVLIDQAAIEKKILIENQETVNKLMQNPPRNCFAAYMLNCDQVCFNPSRFYSFGRTFRSKLNTVRLEDINQLEMELERETNELKSKATNRSQFQQILEKIPQQIQSLQEEKSEMALKERKNLDEMKDLQNKEEERDPQFWQEELEKMMRDHGKKKIEIKECSQKVSDLQMKLNETREDINAKRILLQSLQEKFENLCGRTETLNRNKETLASGKRKFETELKACENKIITCLRNLERDREQFQTALSNAEKLCPRINTERSRSELRALIEETQKVVEKQSNCDREGLSKKYEEKLENLKRAQFELNIMEKSITQIGKMLAFRAKKFYSIQDQTRLMLELAFTTILSGNGYEGHLMFDMPGRSLEMTDICPRGGASSRKNHSSLSGGERSFVTIAFLLALWERTRMPFRILDEYDVFMDANNRQLSVDLLMKKSEGMPQTQFVFLSPLDLPHLNKSDFIHIICLAAPKRRNEDNEEGQPLKRKA